MSKPKLNRNLEIVKLRMKDPETWTYEALRKKYRFKTRSTVHEIIQTFSPKFEKMIPVENSGQKS